ncbi:DUF4142 domain-containing protein [Mesorhizobium sp. M1148]|uniref:DUF4142 domain-containing protein n=1 Tax=unclassified Mesorhizobium TaxID=325217 RepID=UPI0003CE1C90|nr:MULTISPECIES: DUF4142 domain-containing protein [unclassified Mesorhizobium]ESX34124.1 hypothetical protein X764_28690 [Mesorhizobium sp. LSHC440A00]WJI55964.1 DUF4142 domain-containing protein [Mesorhizobium sp. C432A]
MTSKHAAQLEALSNDSSGAFDNAYIDAQVAAHQEALTLMTSYAENGQAKHLAAHAKKTAPVIRQHFKLAQQLSKSGSQC